VGVPGAVDFTAAIALKKADGVLLPTKLVAIILKL